MRFGMIGKLRPPVSPSHPPCGILTKSCHSSLLIGHNDVHVSPKSSSIGLESNIKKERN